MKIAILSNNYSNSDLPTEWGLSIYVEFNNKKILVDTGLSSMFMENAKKLGIDLSKVDYVFLTHAHFDHTDGLPNFHFNGQKIYMHKYEREKYRLIPSGYDFNGVKWSKSDLAGKFTLIENDSFLQVDKGIYLSGSIPRPHGTPKNNFFIKDDDKYTPDEIVDEQLIIFEQSPNSIIVISGCTHFGVKNMTDFIKSKFPNKKVTALFAGLHLKSYDDDSYSNELNSIVNYLGECDLYEKIYALHCTGEKAGKLIEQKLNGKHTFVGEVFEF